jgi:hypothetical protein
MQFPFYDLLWIFKIFPVLYVMIQLKFVSSAECVMRMCSRLLYEQHCLLLLGEIFDESLAS